MKKNLPNQISVKVSRILKMMADEYVGSPPAPYTSISRFSDDAYRNLLQDLHKERMKQ